jgi:hypothetical protein
MKTSACIAHCFFYVLFRIMGDGHENEKCNTEHRRSNDPENNGFHVQESAFHIVEYM